MSSKHSVKKSTISQKDFASRVRLSMNQNHPKKEKEKVHNKHATARSQKLMHYKDVQNLKKQLPKVVKNEKKKQVKVQMQSTFNKPPIQEKAKPIKI